MTYTCFNWLADFKTEVQKSYSSVYDTMYSFFKNGNNQMLNLMKIELWQDIISPFTTKLLSIRTMLEDITFAAQVGFFIAIVVAVIIITISLLDLVHDYKTRILQMRKGNYGDLNMEIVDIKEGANLPGYVISNSVGGFVFVVLITTCLVTILMWPMFWRYLWSIKLTVLTIYLPIQI